MSGDLDPAVRRRWRWFLLAILALATIVRLVGIFGQGLPQCFYPDEVNAVQRSLAFGVRKSLNPGWFNKPALAYYLWFILYGLFYAGGRLIGVFGTPEQFGVWAIDRVGPFVVIGRLMASLFGVATVWLTYRLGKAMGDRRVGLVAALALALMAGHIESGQWVKEDVPCAFFHTAATIALVSMIERGRTKDARRAGLLAGLGTATKYYSAILLVPALVAAFLRNPRGRTGGGWKPGLKLGGWFTGLLLVGFFLGSPYNFLDSSFLHGQVIPRLREISHLFTGSVFGTQIERSTFVNERGAGIARVLLASLDSLGSAGGLGPVFLVLAILGMVRAAVRHTRRDLFLLLAGVWQFVALSVANRQYSEPRHLIVLFPLAAIWIADAVLWPVDALARRRGRATVGPLLPLSIVLVFAILPLPVPSVVKSALGGLGWDARKLPSVAPSAADRLVTKAREALAGDTRLLAMDWFEANVPAGETVIIDQDVLLLRPNEARIDWALDRIAGLKKLGDQRQRLELKRRSAQDRWRPTYDTVFFEVVWETEYRERIPDALVGRDTTWPWRMAIFPAGQPPVERYAHPRGGPPEMGPVDLDHWAVQHLVLGRPVKWVAAAKTTYGNYQRATKREDYAERADFYDDLLHHYDAREWAEGQGVPGPTVRIFDVTHRVSTAEPRVIPMLRGAE